MSSGPFSILSSDEEALIFFYCAGRCLPVPHDALLGPYVVNYSHAHRRPLPLSFDTSSEHFSKLIRAIYRPLARMRCVSWAFAAAPTILTLDDLMSFMRVEWPALAFRPALGTFFTLNTTRYLKRTQDGALLRATARAVLRGGLSEFSTETVMSNADAAQDMVVAGYRPIGHLDGIMAVARQAAALQLVGGKDGRFLGVPFLAKSSVRGGDLCFVDDLPLNAGVRPPLTTSSYDMLFEVPVLQRVTHCNDAQDDPARARRAMYYPKKAIATWLEHRKAQRKDLQFVFDRVGDLVRNEKARRNFGKNYIQQQSQSFRMRPVQQ